MFQQRILATPWTQNVLHTLQLGILASVIVFSGRAGAESADPWISPSAIVLSADESTAYVASATSGEVLFVNLLNRQIISRISVGGEVSGLALSADGKSLAVTSAGPQSRFAVIDLNEKSIRWSIRVGHTALAPVLSLDGRAAYVCNRFNNDVSVIDLQRQKELARIPVEREPVAEALTRDNKHLLVANHLPTGRADVGIVSAHVTVVNLISNKVVRSIALSNGANLLRAIEISPDGHYACVTHSLARYFLPTSQVERGWMNANAFTLIDTDTWEIFATILLDEPERGCANPWGAAWSPDGKYLAISHAGTHELSLIDFPALHAKLAQIPAKLGAKAASLGYRVSQVKTDVPTDLGFLREVRMIIPLTGIGTRTLALGNNRICVGNYFSESLEILDLHNLNSPTTEIPLHTSRPWSAERNGEMFFNDGTICLQSWQSCASCHSSDARIDGLNWDLLNDGVGNPKNTKSLVYAHQTAPAMSMGIRDTAEVAVRAGIQHILYTAQPEETPRAIDQWLKSLTAADSPYLVDGKLSLAAERGQALFNSSEVGCATCHNTHMFTNQKSYDVGTLAPTDQKGDTFDTPVLLELWRTAPYLHDGSAATLKEVLVDRNGPDRHGKTSHLSESQINDLIEFLLSL